MLRIRGFTLLELLVVLGIIAALAALAGPPAYRLYERWQQRLAIQAVLREVERLPWHVRQSGQAVELRHLSDWPVAGDEPLEWQRGGIRVVEPIKVEANGYCHGGVLATAGQGSWRLRLSPPFCQAELGLSGVEESS